MAAVSAIGDDGSSARRESRVIKKMKIEGVKNMKNADYNYFPHM